MNKWQKEVQQSLLDSEEAAIKVLEKQYAAALKDINDKVKLFQADIDLLDEALSQEGLDDATKALLKSQKQSKVYQKQYQQALKGQVSSIIDKMHSDHYSTIEKYLNGCYETGYIGTMYDIAKQGIPIIAPIDQAAAVKAILTDSKIVEGYYNHLGVNYAKLKKTITQEISRGIASGLPYRDIARNIDNVSGSGVSNAKRIARTEGHRIQQSSTRDAQITAKKKGADVVKQWDAALDKRTRDSHARVDGEIKELDEKFSNGLMFPGDPSGGAAEVINCRCTSNTRARWALDDAELQTLKERAEYFGLDKTKNFDDFKQKYLDSATQVKYDWGTIPKESISSYQKTFDMLSEKYPLKNNPVTWVGDFRISNGYDLAEDFIDLTDRETQWFGVGARFMPDSKFSTKPYIEIVDPEIRVGTASEHLEALAEIRRKNGWHGRQNSFYNMVGNTETAMIHEYGHAVAYDCGLYGSAETARPLWELFESTTNEEIERQLSIYATANHNEMLAEAFVQSFAPEDLQSELCKTIMKLIKDARNKI